MAAPSGNEFYKMVQGPKGRPPIYNSANDLWVKAVEYFKWVNDNPLYEVKGFAFQGEVTMQNFPKMRAMTESAFCLFAGISPDTFRRYKNPQENDSKDFCEVANKIATIIYQQKFEGASADFLNANIIARDLGLTDKTQTAITDPDGNALQPIININIVQPIKPPDEAKEWLGEKG